MTTPRQAAEQLLKYLGGDADVWDGYGVAEVAEIMRPLVEDWLAQNPKRSAKEVAEQLSEQFRKNRQFEGQR